MCFGQQMWLNAKLFPFVLPPAEHIFPHYKDSLLPPDLVTFERNPTWCGILYTEFITLFHIFGTGDLLRSEMPLFLKHDSTMGISTGLPWSIRSLIFQWADVLFESVLGYSCEDKKSWFLAGHLFTARVIVMTSPKKNETSVYGWSC